MALQISRLRPDDQAIACKCFGPPPQVAVKKFTGGEPQHYQKVRRELQTIANGKNIWNMFDYMVWANVVAAALPAGQPVNFGAQGVNIVEATVAMMAPNRANFVIAAVNAALATEVANHAARIASIAQAFPGNGNAGKRLEETFKANNDHRTEVARINSTFQSSLDSRFESESDRHRKSVHDFEEDQAKCMDLFLKLFNGSALHSIQPYLQANAFRRALYLLDEQFGLAPANQEAIDVLQSRIRNAKFLDSENFRTQLDDFEMTLNELTRLGVGFSNSDKISMLQRCLANGGLIGRLFMHDMGLLRSRVLTLAGAPVPTYAQVLDIVNRRYADLSAEASSIEIIAKPLGGKRARLSSYFASDEAEDEEGEVEEPRVVALAAVTKPHHGRPKGNKPRCGKCGRPGHTAKQCRQHLICKKCGKPGHSEKDCWKDQTCENCGRKGHPARVCKSPGAKKASSGGAGSGATSSSGGSITERVMKHVRGSS
jgi:Zinc knuckle